MNKKKRHHYTPKTYLHRFCNDDGKLCVWRKDEPDKSFYSPPDGVGLERHYYRQPLVGGGYDHNSLEDGFSQLEGEWPHIVDALERREGLAEKIGDLWSFVALQRCRVPAFRSEVELFLADLVKAETKMLDRMGQLSLKPKGLEDILDRMEVSIDPHMSIHAMLPAIEGMGQLFDVLGFMAIHNQTETPFATSDNPVMWLDPTVKLEEAHPYTWRPGGQVMFMFPVSSEIMIWGDRSLYEAFRQDGMQHSDLSNVPTVNFFNEWICRFAYGLVMAKEKRFDAQVTKHASESPIWETTKIPANRGIMHLIRSRFGPRRQRRKWSEDE